MLVDTIKADALEARRGRSTASGIIAALLSALLGEIETKTKTLNPARAMTDAEVVSVAIKFKKNNEEAIHLVDRLQEPRRSVEREKLENENTALAKYIPSQMSEEDIETFVRNKVTAGTTAIGTLMAALKNERGGAYDGKLASAVVKRVIG